MEASPKPSLKKYEHSKIIIRLTIVQYNELNEKSNKLIKI